MVACERCESFESSCIKGVLYGDCESEYCTGLCEYEGLCACDCHKE